MVLSLHKRCFLKIKYTIIITLFHFNNPSKFYKFIHIFIPIYFTIYLINLFTLLKHILVSFSNFKEIHFDLYLQTKIIKDFLLANMQFFYLLSLIEIDKIQVIIKIFLLIKFN